VRLQKCRLKLTSCETNRHQPFDNRSSTLPEASKGVPHGSSAGLMPERVGRLIQQEKDTAWNRYDEFRNPSSRTEGGKDFDWVFNRDTTPVWLGGCAVLTATFILPVGDLYLVGFPRVLTHTNVFNVVGGFINPVASRAGNAYGQNGTNRVGRGITNVASSYPASILKKKGGSQYPEVACGGSPPLAGLSTSRRSLQTTRTSM
jgi:hypothetical protein